MAVTGTLLFCVCFSLGTSRTNASSLSYRFGLAIGWLMIWPAVVIMLFSIWRKFRSLRAWIIITLVIWSLTMFGNVADLMRARGERQFNLKMAESQRGVPRGTSLPSAPKAGEGTPEKTGSVSPAMDLEAAKEFDFTAGSDERLIKDISTAQEDRYHRIVAAYRAAIAMQPKDPRLALERLRFIEHFANAEDVTIKAAADDYTAAKAYLEKHFPEAPETVLLQLGQSFGEEFTAKVQEFSSQALQWPARQAARFFLIQAQRAAGTGKPERIESMARKSFALEKSPEAAVLLARALVDLTRKSEAVEVLDEADFSAAVPWLKKQRMELLFDLGSKNAALKALDELKASAPLFVSSYDMAHRLGRAGLVSEGRQLLGELGRDWNSEWGARQRFDFELEFGDSSAATAAYEALRGLGWREDPFARDWGRLLWRHPSAPWSIGAFVSVGALVLAVMFAALVPLLLLAPVHHWSLWRARHGRTAAPTAAPWGLRAAWLFLAVACVGELLVAWYFYPERLQWERSARMPGASVENMLSATSCLWVVTTIALVAMLWRAKAWRVLGPGSWSVPKAIGIGLGLAFALRAAAFFYVAIAPTQEPLVAQASPAILQMLRQLRETLGAVGMLAVIAVFVPVLEELAFRGVALGAMAKHIPFAAANILQAIAFAALHQSWLLAPFYFGFALIAGVLVRRGGGLLPAIVMHGVNNGVAGLAFLFAGSRLGG